MEKVLRLGRVDEDVHFTEAEKKAFLDLYHHPYGFSGDEIRFRDDSRNQWYRWENIPGQRIRALTQFLQGAGFMPYAAHDGIFGYVTQAAVRLFQEYVRTIAEPQRHQQRSPACWPDGVVGRDTQFYIDRWREKQVKCRWTSGESTPDHRRWLQWLTSAAAYYEGEPSTVMRHLQAAGRRGDSLKPEEWSFDRDDTHLIGIRRKANEDRGLDRRPPDDLFILLLNGRSFYFWGSTDSNPSNGKEGYLIEGQHRYRLNWHNISIHRRERIYKAARPATTGVMVVRDVHGHNALTDANRRDGFDPEPNPTFNIHWSGLGISNWSAGCQVISGKNYVNDSGDLISCAEYAARNDRERGTRRAEDGPRLTMGAYSLLSDLVLCYTPQKDLGKKPTFLYTLFQEEAFDHLGDIKRTEIGERVSALRSEGFF